MASVGMLLKRIDRVLNAIREQQLSARVDKEAEKLITEALLHSIQQFNDGLEPEEPHYTPEEQEVIDRFAVRHRSHIHGAKDELLRELQRGRRPPHNMLYVDGQ